MGRWVEENIVIWVRMASGDSGENFGTKKFLAKIFRPEMALAALAALVGTKSREWANRQP